MLATRALTALVGLPAGIVLMYLGGWYWMAVIAVMMIKGQHEFLSAARKRGCQPCDALVYVFGLSLLLTVQAAPGNWELRAVLSIVFVMAIMTLEVFRKSQTHFANAGVALLAFFYIAWLMGYLVLMQRLEASPSLERPSWPWTMPFGFSVLLYTFGVTWITDTGAYLVGKNLGRSKLCPSISPGKTVEGSYGAFLTAIVASAVLGTGFIGLPIAHAVLLGVIMGVLGQLGDLAKSVLKREAGIKDFGAVFPGHGGVLDRFDAVLFNAIIIYYYVAALNPAAAVASSL